ncbi:MAG: hypothetical protein RR334_02665 [Clostridia bacterium]
MIENYVNIYSGYKYFLNVNNEYSYIYNYQDILKTAEKYISVLTTLIIKHKIFDESFVLLKREVDKSNEKTKGVSLSKIQSISYVMNKSFEDIEDKLSFLISNEDEKQYINGLLR